MAEAICEIAVCSRYCFEITQKSPRSFAATFRSQCVLDRGARELIGLLHEPTLKDWRDRIIKTHELHGTGGDLAKTRLGAGCKIFNEGGPFTVGKTAQEPDNLISGTGCIR